MLNKTFLLTTMLVLILSTNIFAEIVVLKSGQKLEGKIIERTDKYIKMDPGVGMVMTYYNDEISTINGQSPSQLTLITPVASKNGGVSLGWQISNFSTGAIMTFFAQNDKSVPGIPLTGFTKKVITAAEGKYEWDGCGVPPGQYFIYAQFESPNNAPKEVYASDNPSQVDCTTDLSMTFSGLSKIKAGDSFSLNIKVVDAGKRDVTDADVLIQLPAGLMFSPGQSGITKAGSNWRIKIPPVMAGSPVNVSFTVKSDRTLTNGPQTIRGNLESFPILNTNKDGKSASFKVNVN